MPGPMAISLNVSGTIGPALAAGLGPLSTRPLRPRCLRRRSARHPLLPFVGLPDPNIVGAHPQYLAIATPAPWRTTALDQLDWPGQAVSL
jgi:hypothetical protein